MKLRSIIALLLCLLAADVSATSVTTTGAGTQVAAAAYQGPMDAYVGTPYAFYSCARVARASAASTSTNLCDLVASTGGAAVCTLRGTSSGFVDLAASYCAGTTPAAACAAASGGSCRVTKMYNQISPGTADVSNATLSEMPPLTFSALNSLPGITVTSANTNRLLSGAVTQAQPLTFATVANRASGTNTASFIGSNSTPPGLDGGNATNTWALTSDGTNILTRAANDGSFHSGQGVLNGASSFMTIDGSSGSTANAGTNGYSSASISISRANGDSQDAVIMEAMIWASAANSTDTAAINTNARSANGYGSF